MIGLPQNCSMPWLRRGNDKLGFVHPSGIFATEPSPASFTKKGVSLTVSADKRQITITFPSEDKMPDGFYRISFPVVGEGLGAPTLIELKYRLITE